MSLTRSQRTSNNGEATAAENISGDPQVFYFGVFDGHGGAECSTYLKDKLHAYIEESAKQFELGSSLRASERLGSGSSDVQQARPESKEDPTRRIDSESGREELDDDTVPPIQKINEPRAVDLETTLVQQWKELVGGYFRRFRPEYFFLSGRGGIVRDPQTAKEEADRAQREGVESTMTEVGIETVLTYAFLKADLDFITAQVARAENDPVLSDKALNEGEILGQASALRKPPQSQKTFKGGSTCSVAMISTPTATPFWNPASPSSLVTSHVGDTRVILCTTADGQAKPLTTDHHPSSPGEGNRLRRYAATFVTDSFGEERMTGLANTRAFGDMQSKRIGVSAEPEVRRLEMKPAEYSFLVLVSDGISGTLNDQEIVDIVKEAKTPDQGAKDVVSFATEVSKEGDNATCLVVRLGGWERRSEGGLGSMGTKEGRDWRSQEASEPRSRRQ
jgi:protein phosphatase PTC6